MYMLIIMHALQYRRKEDEVGLHIFYLYYQLGSS